jgi:23S rRNA pseudouridine2605 synthase
MTAERLQKVMAASGLGSRRACEEIIRQGRVTVNGQLATLGSSADPALDEIRFDGQRLRPPQTGRTFALYKPRGVVSSLAPQGPRTTVRELLPVDGRYYPVGRLDIDSDGLMLLTNDGSLADRVTHPRYEQEKEYHILLARRPSTEQLEIWQRGVVLEDGFRTGRATVSVERQMGKGAWVRVVMREGHKHEIREIASRIGLPVVRLTRIRIGNIVLGNMKPGEWRELNADEIAALRAGDALHRFESKSSQPQRREKPTNSRTARPPRSESKTRTKEQRIQHSPSPSAHTPRPGLRSSLSRDRDLNNGSHHTRTDSKTRTSNRQDRYDQPFESDTTSDKLKSRTSNRRNSISSSRGQDNKMRKPASNSRATVASEQNTSSRGPKLGPRSPKPGPKSRTSRQRNQNKTTQGPHAKRPASTPRAYRSKHDSGKARRGRHGRS